MVIKKKTAVKNVSWHKANARMIKAEDKLLAYISKGKPANMTNATYKRKIATLLRAWAK